jgi:DNA-binding CsgD family transcriptional regulator
MIRRKYFFVLTVLIFIPWNCFAQETASGIELRKVVEKFQRDPLILQKQLQRLENFIPQMNQEERLFFIENYCTLLSHSLRDQNLASQKLSHFSKTFKPKKEADLFHLRCLIIRANIESEFASEHEETITELEEALKLKIEDKEDSTFWEKGMLRLSDALHRKKRYYKSLRIQQNVLAASSNRLSSGKIAQIEFKLSQNLRLLGKKDSADYYLNHAYLLSTATQDNVYLPYIALDLHRIQKQPQLGLKFLLIAFQHRSNLKSHEERADLCGRISRIFKKSNINDKALQFKELETHYLDSLRIDKESSQKVLLAYELQKKENKSQRTQATLKEMSFQLKVGIGVVCVLVLLLAFSFIFRSKRRKATSLEGIVSVLEKESPEKIVEKEALLTGLISNLKTTVSKTKWDEFEGSFLAENNQFIEKLLASHPKLSSNDRRLCMCLSQNMPTKEISTLTGQNEHAINIARGRLRKKLSIDHQDVSLPDYLKKFL